MIDVGLIGFGLAGRAFHAQVIRAVPGLRLAAILQRNGNEAAEQYPDVRIVRTLEELLAIKEIRLIVIATPTIRIFLLAQQCLAAGRDVLVDKPFTTTLEEAIALVEFAKKQGRTAHGLPESPLRRRFSGHRATRCERRAWTHRSL